MGLLNPAPTGSSEAVGCVRSRQGRRAQAAGPRVGLPVAVCGLRHFRRHPVCRHGSLSPTASSPTSRGQSPAQLSPRTPFHARAPGLASCPAILQAQGEDTECRPTPFEAGFPAGSTERRGLQNPRVSGVGDSLPSRTRLLPHNQRNRGRRRASGAYQGAPQLQVPEHPRRPCPSPARLI